MRRDAEFFGERELALVYIANRLKKALQLEEVLTLQGIDYLVEPGEYEGGFLFHSRRIGAFFFVAREQQAEVSAIMNQNGFKPQELS